MARELDEFGRTIRPKLGSKTSFSDVDSVSTPGTEYSESILWQSENGTEETESMGSVSSHPLALLNRLRNAFRNDEFALYGMIKQVEGMCMAGLRPMTLAKAFLLSVGHMNDVRKAFYDCARSAKNRLTAWTRKHLNKSELKELGAVRYDEPEYFAQDKHTFPGSPFLVREDEPLSIIAFRTSGRWASIRSTRYAASFRAKSLTLPEATIGYPPASVYFL